ncbi:protein kinase [Endozoicomonas sp. Mp262]|uniref:protein kinase domain-containing protein n=1 Tax=Endozoicomonas sp. Mp262 TaxID=2919499 RepID=UPI0021DAAA86
MDALNTFNSIFKINSISEDSIVTKFGSWPAQIYDKFEKKITKGKSGIGHSKQVKRKVRLIEKDNLRVQAYMRDRFFSEKPVEKAIKVEGVDGNKYMLKLDPVNGRAEKRALSKLGNETIVKAVELETEFPDNFVEGSVVCTEFFDGTVLDKVDFNKKTEEEVRGILIQLLGAVDYVHKQGLTHGDLHGENVLVNDRGEVKLIDFGMSRNKDKGSYDNRSLGIYLMLRSMGIDKKNPLKQNLHDLGVFLRDGKITFAQLKAHLMKSGISAYNLRAWMKTFL